MADKVKLVLHPDAVVYIFRHGHTLPSVNGAEGDFSRVLSEKGIRQSDQLGQTIATAKIEFDQVICSAAPRAQQTYNEVIRYLKNNFAVYMGGNGRELYSPASDKDYAATWTVTEEMERQFNAGTIPSAMSYSEFKRLDSTGFFDRFMEETRKVVLSLPSISEAHKIAIFSHAVIGNAVAEALFPQHVTELDEIELAPCDCIRLTVMSCDHIRLMS